MRLNIARLALVTSHSLLAMAPALAQEQAFPEGASVPAAAQISQHLSNKVYTTTLADGSTMRLDFKSSGYVFVDTSRGRNLKGEWTTEDGRLCTTINQSGAPACGDARMLDGVLYIKRPANGEVIKYLPK